MSALADRLRTDMTAAMKAKDGLTRDTLRMAMTAVRTAEVSGSQSRELTDADVVAVLNKESKKRAEAAEAFDAAGRTESAQRERDESAVLARYLPAALSEAELAELVRGVIAEGGFAGPANLGAVMKLVQPRVAGRADGRKVAAEVRTQLGAG